MVIFGLGVLIVAAYMAPRLWEALEWLPLVLRVGLCAVAGGIVLTIVGLIFERLREGKIDVND